MERGRGGGRGGGKKQNKGIFFKEVADQLTFAGYSPWKFPPDINSFLSANTICSTQKNHTSTSPSHKILTIERFYNPIERFNNPIERSRRMYC